MKLFKPAILSVIIFMIITVLNSCIDDFKSIKNWELTDSTYAGEFAAPLVHVSLDFKDFAKYQELDSILFIDSTNFIKFIYRGHWRTAYARNYIPIPDQNFGIGPLSYSFTGPDSVQVSNDIVFSNSTEYQVSMVNGEQLSLMKLKSGFLDLVVTSTFARTGIIIFEMPDVKKNNIAFRDSVFFIFNNTKPVKANKHIDLSGYSFDLTKGSTSFNNIRVNYTVRLFNSTRYVKKTDAFRLDITFSESQFSYLEGFLGQHDYTFSADSMKINMFDDIEAGKIYFADPKIQVNIWNSIGLPIRITTENFGASHKTNGSLTLSSPLVANPIFPGFPSIAQKGESIPSVYTLNQLNSNIDDILGLPPQIIFYDFKVESNYSGPAYTNHVTDSSHVKVQVEFELPIFGKTSGWHVEGNGDIQFPDALDNIESVQFNLLIGNGFPVEARAQFYLADSALNIIDSLVSNPSRILMSAAVGSDGKVIAPTNTLTKIIYDKARVDRLKTVSKYIISADLSTTDFGNTNVKVYSDYKLDVKLSAKIKANITR